MFKLNGINNESSIGYKEVGQTHDFKFDGTVFIFGDIQSSRVKSIEVVEKDLIVHTKNSRYIFVKVEGK